MRAELKVGFNPQVEMGLTRSCKKWIWRVQRCEAPFLSEHLDQPILAEPFFFKRRQSPQT